MNTNLLLYKSVGGSSFLLDDYPTATNAFSLEYLKSSLTGAVIRVERDSDNTQQDFTPTEITDGTLETFVGVGNNGYVVTWYDQGTRGLNLTGTSLTEVPKIVDNGSLLLNNGKPYMEYPGAKDGGLSINGNTISGNVGTTFTVINTNDTGDGVLIGSASTSRYIGFYQNGSTSIPDSRGGNPNYYSNGSLLTPNDRTSLYNGVVLNTDVLITINGHNPAGASSWSTIAPFIYGVSSSTPNMKVKEFVMFQDNDMSTDRTAIEANINSRYSIY